MPTKLAIDETLLDEALRISGLKTKKAAVNEALRQFVQHHKQAKVIESFGKIDYVKDDDPKALRRR